MSRHFKKIGIVLGILCIYVSACVCFAFAIFNGLFLMESFRAHRLDDNSLFFETGIEQVLGFTYKSPKMTIKASRTKPADDFLMSVNFLDGRPPQKCLAPKLFVSTVPKFLRVMVDKQLTNHDKLKYPNSLGTIEIQTILGEDFDLVFVFQTTLDNSSVALTSEELFFTTPIAVEAFKNISAGCSQ